MKSDKKERCQSFLRRRGTKTLSPKKQPKESQHNIVPKLIGLGERSDSEESEKDSDTASSTTPTSNDKEGELTLKHKLKFSPLKRAPSLPTQINSPSLKRSAIFNKHKDSLKEAPLSKGELDWFREVFSQYVQHKSERIMRSSQKVRLMKRLFDHEWPQLIVLFLEWKLVTNPNHPALTETQRPFLNYLIHEYQCPFENIDQLITIFMIGLQVELASVVHLNNAQTLFRDSWVMQLLPRINAITVKMQNDVNERIRLHISRVDPGWPYYYNLSNIFPKFYNDTQLGAVKKLMIGLCDLITEHLPGKAFRSTIVILYQLLNYHAPRILALNPTLSEDDEVSDATCHNFAMQKTLSVLWLRVYGPMIFPGHPKSTDPDISEVLCFLSKQFSAAINNKTKEDIVGKPENQNLKLWYDYMDEYLSPYLRSKLYDYITRCIQAHQPTALRVPHRGTSILWPSEKIKMPKVTLLPPPPIDDEQQSTPRFNLQRSGSIRGLSPKKRENSSNITRRFK